MKSQATRADFFDASALVKVFTDEPFSGVVRTYWHSRPTKHTTPFCFYESLNVLKAKHRNRGQLTETEYLKAAFELTAWYGASSKQVRDLSFEDPQTFAQTRGLAQRHKLDLSDAFQVMSVKQGYYSRLVNDSRTVFVTADVQLARAARAEGLRVWSVTEDQPLEQG